MGTAIARDQTTGRCYRKASVFIKPDLHLSQSTAKIKLDRFSRHVLDEFNETNRINKELQKKVAAKYRKRVPRFRALCQYSRPSRLMWIIDDTPKMISGFELIHFTHPKKKRMYFGLSPFIVTNKQMRRTQPEACVTTIAISGHTLERMLERCSTNLMLDIEGIRLLLSVLLVETESAEFDEKGTCRLGIEMFPDMIFVCCKDRWKTDDRTVLSTYTIVTYFEKK